MRPSIAQELKQTFHVHALHHEARHNLTGRQWDQYQQWTTRCDKARNREEKLFDERYQGRVDQECRKIMRDKAAMTRKMKPITHQDDLFDRTALLAQADRNVRNRHHQRLGRITQIEERGIERLLQRSARTNQHTGQSKDAFARAATRRSGQDRRSSAQQSGKPVHRQTR